MMIVNKNIGDMSESELKDFIIELQEENSRYERINQKYQEVFNKAIEWVKDWTHSANDWFEEDSKPSELLDILKEVE